jgi:hypothetical protein
MVQRSGKATLPVSPRLKSIKSPYMRALKKCVATLHSYLMSVTYAYEQGSRPVNGHQRNFGPKTTNAPSKYPQSLGTHSGWSRRQYIFNCASGANSTPLGSPRRMSPVDPLAVESSLLSASAAASVSEHGEGKRRDPGAAADVCLIYTSNCVHLFEVA